LARKILLADDSVTAQNMGRKILADAGYDVVTVNNGSAALKRIAELKPDLIVLDVYMPGYSGLEVCQRVKDADETAHIPVLLTVGKLEPFKPDEARRVRADAHIVKPFEASELLTAITRLEDRMVPQHSEGSRFSASVAGVERFTGDGSGRKRESEADADTGWKSRLRFPSKKKKEEPEPEADDAAAGATFRDFRKAKGKTGASGVLAVKAPAPPGQEPGLVPDIPRDITPEELDALSAVAEKLDGPIPAAENIAPLAEKMGPIEAPAAEVAAAKTEAIEAEAAKTEVEAPAAVAEAKKEVETPAPVVEPAAAAVEAPALAVETPALAVEGKNEVEIPAEHLELAAEGATVVADAAAVEIHHPEPQHPETPAAVVAVAVDTALLAQEPAPVDRNDEPAFASTASAVEQAAEDKAETIEGNPAEAIAQIEKSETAEASAPEEAVAAKGVESKPEESNAQQVNVEELKAENTAPPVPVEASAPETAEAEEPAPSDEELAEALRLLTPATAHADASTIPSHGTLVAAGQLLAEEAARNAAGSPRWVAEPVALSPEEAAISLEAEMFRTFAVMPAVMPAAISAATSGGEIETTAITGVSAIAAAVENRLAAAEMAAAVKDLAEQGDERSSGEAGSGEHGSTEHGSTELGSETTAAETLAVEAPAEVTAVSNGATPLVDGIAPEIEPEKLAPEKIEPEKIEPEKVAPDIEPEKLEAEQKDSAAKVAEEAPEEEVAAATFADAVGKDEAEAAAEQNGEPVSGTTAAVAEENQDTSSDSGSQESMGRDVKSKSGKSNWHQIHTAPASAAASSDVETAKQAEPVADEAPKAMAAAAAAEGGRASSSATDASTIASIVDSIMADLRPKIVEEIARKLAGK
jgi:CheY-like chemotaxis protein